MKQITRLPALVAGAVALVILLGASVAQAAEVIRDGNNATGITGLDVDGTFYDVTFVFDSAQDIYGDFPGIGDPFPFDFSDVNDAEDAVEAVNAVLSAAGILGVSDQSATAYNVPYTFTFVPFTGQAAVGTGGVIQQGLAWVVDPTAPNNWAWETSFVYAKFVESTGGPTPTEFTLTVNKAGDGSGPVTSSPSGINCGDDCTATFDEGTSVTLTATPNPGSVLTRWTGCDVILQLNTCTVDMDEDKNVTVTYSLESVTHGINPGILDVILGDD